MTGSVQPYCSGIGCAMDWKLNCCRYKQNIDIKTEANFPFAPYNGGLGWCTFFEGENGVKYKQFFKLLKDGRAKNNPIGED
jgi:hypothetical protein